MSLEKEVDSVPRTWTVHRNVGIDGGTDPRKHVKYLTLSGGTDLAVLWVTEKEISYGS